MYFFSDVVIHKSQGLPLYYRHGFSVSIFCFLMAWQVYAGKENHIVHCRLADQALLELIDLSKAKSSPSQQQHQQDASIQESMTNTEAAMDGQNIQGPIRGSKRYISFSALTEEVGVWDLCTAQCIRSCALSKSLFRNC